MADWKQQEEMLFKEMYFGSPQVEVRSFYEFQKQLARFVHEKFVMQPLVLKVLVFYIVLQAFAVKR